MFVFNYIAINAMYGRRQYEGSRTDVREDLDVLLEHVGSLSTFDVAGGGNLLAEALRRGRRPLRR